MLDDLRASVSHLTGTNVRGMPIAMGNPEGKRAITHQGRVTLSSQATEHDLAHELAHAAQQRASGGAWIGGGDAERRADDIASASLEGRLGSIASGRVPMAAVLGAGDPYSREAITLPPPPAGFTTKDWAGQLDAKIASGDITGYAIAGVKLGDPEEPFLYNALVLLASKARWGSELDVVTSIGAGKGAVTIRFDAAGKAEAELVGKSAPIVPMAFRKAGDASAAVKTQYKLANVKGEHGKTWSVDDLNKVLAAWGRLSTTEAAALEGYTLVRTDKVELNGEALQGQTTHSDELVTGESTVKHLREMRFADSAFVDDSRSFIGDGTNAGPASFEVLIHEVGHALEAKPYDDLNAVAAMDSDKANAAGAVAHAAQLAMNKAIKAASAGRYQQKDLTAAQPLFTAVLAAQQILQAFEQTPDTTREAAAASAIADRNTVKASIPTGNRIVAALSASMAKQDSYFTTLKAFLTARDTAAASRTSADALLSGSNTKRLQAFLDFVTKEKIAPPTAYARQHWPAEPAEFYNEAFSLWKNDPKFFGKYSSKLKQWFDDGKYL
ncbi:MAG: hypothetical protein SGJ09_02900 [Phycisphaerae bacterium]|nr:hypothetical protein [Phycisphaerae bacterium]